MIIGLDDLKRGDLFYVYFRYENQVEKFDCIISRSFDAMPFIVNMRNLMNKQLFLCLNNDKQHLHVYTKCKLYKRYYHTYKSNFQVEIISRVKE